MAVNIRLTLRDVLTSREMIWPNPLFAAVYLANGVFLVGAGAITHQSVYWPVALACAFLVMVSFTQLTLVGLDALRGAVGSRVEDNSLPEISRKNDLLSGRLSDWWARYSMALARFYSLSLAGLARYVVSGLAYSFVIDLVTPDPDFRIAGNTSTILSAPLVLTAYVALCSGFVAPLVRWMSGRDIVGGQADPKRANASSLLARSLDVAVFVVATLVMPVPILRAIIAELARAAS